MADYRKVRAHLAQQTRRRRGLASLLGGMVTAAALLTAATGCSTFNGLNQSLQHCDCVDDFMIGHRNRALAAKAWHEHKRCCGNRKHLRDYEAGFKAGFIDVANGSDGCTPAIAPDSYWGWRYQSPEGQAKVAAWFAGYPMGAKAAEEAGLGNWSQIPTMFPQTQQMPPYVPDGGAIEPYTATPYGMPIEGSSYQVLPEGVPVTPAPVQSGSGAGGIGQGTGAGSWGTGVPQEATPVQPAPVKEEADPFGDEPTPAAPPAKPIEGTTAQDFGNSGFGQRPAAGFRLPQ